jgi:hypothetical protein
MDFLKRSASESDALGLKEKNPPGIRLARASRLGKSGGVISCHGIESIRQHRASHLPAGLR